MPAELLYFERLGVPLPRSWPLSLIGRPEGPVDDTGRFVDERRFASWLMERFIVEAQRRGWRATNHGEWDVADARWDPDHRIDVVADNVSVAIILFPPSNVSEVGWIGFEPDLPAADLKPIVSFASQVLSTSPLTRLIEPP